MSGEDAQQAVWEKRQRTTQVPVSVDTTRVRKSGREDLLVGWIENDTGSHVR